MNVKELIKGLNKIKKKYENAPVIYVYGDKPEMTFVELDDIKVIYVKESDKDIFEKYFSKEEFDKIEFSKEEKEGYLPLILVSEVNL